MRLSVIGSGYVGLVAGTCFADSGNDVVCVDIDQKKIDALKQGRIPIYEPGLEDLVKKNVREKRLSFTTDFETAVGNSQVVFIAVGTPEGESGDADLQYVLKAASQIGRAMKQYTVVVDKSTVPVGTADLVREAIAKETKQSFDVVSNPEFLKEGAALDDFLKPDRVVIGVDSERARAVMADLYAPFVRTENPIIFMDTRSAELTKYAANAMLATRISFMNDMAALCERVGADVDLVRKGMGADKRIGYPFLFPGVGYGGSCLEGRETVLVQRGERQELIKLQRLFAEYAGPGVDASPAPAVVHPGGLSVHAWTKKGGAVLPVEGLSRRPFEGELLEVRTKLGRRVRCTPDHPFVTASGVKLASELTEEDWLPLAIGEVEQVTQVPERLDVLGIALARAGLRREQVIVRVGPKGDAKLAALGTEGLTSALAPLGHERGRERVYDILRARALRLDEAEAAQVPLDDAMVGTARNGTYVPTFVETSEAFWRVVGLYLAEGHSTTDGLRRRLAWSFHPTDEQSLVETVAHYWRSLGVKADVRRGSTTMQVSVSSRILAGLLVEGLGLGADCYSHRIPDRIWTAPESHRRALLQGLWLGDGSWSFVSGGPSVVLEYGTVSRALADGMLRLLGGLGVSARLKVGRTAKSTTDTYWLVVAGANQVERLMELIPVAEHEEVRTSLARQAKRIAPTGSRVDAQGSTWVRVRAIHRKPFKGFVYSLEVPVAHTFVTTGGLVVHNCFPKDVKALVATAREHGIEFDLLRAVERTNERQKKLLVAKAVKHFGADLSGKTFGVWGLAFKPKTDDMREAPSVEVIEGLLGKGAKVKAFDPVAHETAKRVLNERVSFVETPYDAVEGVDALFVVTEWNEFRHPDFERMRGLMKSAVVFDGRNIYAPAKMKELGFTYFGIGRR